MKLCLQILTSLFLLFGVLELEACGMQYSMGATHFAREMEFFYRKPRSEIIVPALAALNRDGMLARSETRLFLASFLAELARIKKIDSEKIIKECLKFGENGRHLAAWFVHFALLANEKKQLEEILRDDKILLTQIQRTPAPLEKLNPSSDQTVLQMYWAAFMASGKMKWLDSIIDTALEWHKAKKMGRRGPDSGSAAAASLYEMAPAHEIIQKRLSERVTSGNGDESEMINMILKK